MEEIAREVASHFKQQIAGALASVIAHDLNNQLTVILGDTTLALELLGHDHPAGMSLEQALQAVQRCIAMTRGLLNLSPGAKPELGPAPLDQLLAGTDRMLRRAFAGSASVRSRRDTELPQVLADTIQLQQVILNLAADAVNVVSGPCVLEVDARNGPRHVTISITASRGGNERQPGLMERLPSAKAREAEIVSAHGGWIDVARAHSAVTYRITLPAPNRPDAGESHGGSACILIAEDEDQVRRAAVQVLLRKGYNVIEARNGEEAVRIFAGRATAIDLVFLDVSMPGLSGLETLDYLRKVNPNVKVLLSSGYPVEAKAGFLAKPYSPRQLVRKLEEILAA